MDSNKFGFYSILKNEDAEPFIGDDLMIVADGLGGSGSAKHNIDRTVHKNISAELWESAFGDMGQSSVGLKEYINRLIEPLLDGDRTSALWASRIAISRCAYALTEDGDPNVDGGRKDLSADGERRKLADFISKGLCETVRKFDLKNGKYGGQLLLPTTLAFIRYTECEDSVIAESVWAGDSRCYVLTADGLKLFSDDDEDASGSITNLFYAGNDKVKLNYLKREIKKPCILISASDGIFDPFEPHDNSGVECTLLNAIEENNSLSELAEYLKKYYDEIHSDDATMTFAAFGYRDYEEIKSVLGERCEIIKSICKALRDNDLEFEVKNLTENEAKSYVCTRMSDKYDAVVAYLIDALKDNKDECIITDKLKELRKNEYESCKKQVEEEKNQRINAKLDKLRCYVGTSLDDEKKIFRAWEILNKNYYWKRYGKGTPEYKKDKKIRALKNQYKKDLAKLSELLSKLDQESSKILENLDSLPSLKRMEGMGTEEYSKRLVAWMAGFLNKIIEYIKKVKICQVNLPKQRKQILKDLESLISSVMNKPENANKIFNKDTVEKYFLDDSEETLARRAEQMCREGMEKRLKAEKSAFIEEIVAVMADNFDKETGIDRYFNQTRLAKFRTFYRLKSDPVKIAELEKTEEKLAQIEGEYRKLLDDEDKDRNGSQQ